MFQLSYPENGIPRPLEIGPNKLGFGNIFDKREQKEGERTYKFSDHTYPTKNGQEDQIRS